MRVEPGHLGRVHAARRLPPLRREQYGTGGCLRRPASGPSAQAQRAPPQVDDRSDSSGPAIESHPGARSSPPPPTAYASGRGCHTASVEAAGELWQRVSA